MRFGYQTFVVVVVLCFGDHRDLALELGHLVGRDDVRVLVPALRLERKVRRACSLSYC